MKKKIFSIAMIVLCLAIITGGTAAYFTAEDSAQNVITTGGIAVKLIEQQMVGDRLESYPSQPIMILPGTAVSKIVTVKSLQEPAWIRMSYSITVCDAAGEKMDITAEELAKVILIEADTEHWLLRDGMWYYKDAVKEGQSTEPLFKQVAFSAAMDNRYQGCTVLIDVTAQAVQKANNGESVLDAAGWPEE